MLDTSLGRSGILIRSAQVEAIRVVEAGEPVPLRYERQYSMVQTTVLLSELESKKSFMYSPDSFICRPCNKD